MKRDIFKERKEYAPDEYPEMVELMDKIETTHWIHNELTFFSDIQEIENLQEYEREAIIRSLLAISTVEVKVKDFWTHLGKTFPKPEFYELGVVHGASECYDDQTEILTESGWKFFKDLQDNDKVMQFNQSTENFELTNILAKVEYHYEGDLHHYVDENINLMVTPNHELLIVDPHTGKYVKRYSSIGPDPFDLYISPIVQDDSSIISIISSEYPLKELVPYDGLVYCVTVESSNIVVRRGGKIIVSGNSRHSRSYSRIIRLLNLEDRFKECLSVPAVDGRYKYLDKYLNITDNPKDFTRYITKLILFTILIENVSLFSQFATVCYFYRHKGIMKDIRNVIAWSASDEQIHAITGITIINILREEHPEFFTEELEDKIRKACIKSVKYEANLLDWVFENGEFSKLSKQDLLNYMKSRVNNSLTDMGFKGAFEEVGSLENVKFFEEEVFGTKSDDFFAVRPVDYTANDIEISANTIF